MDSDQYVVNKELSLSTIAPAASPPPLGRRAPPSPPFLPPGIAFGVRKVNVWLLEKVDSNSHGARPVHSEHLDDLVDSDQ